MVWHRHMTQAKQPIDTFFIVETIIIKLKDDMLYEYKLIELT